MQIDDAARILDLPATTVEALQHLRTPDEPVELTLPTLEQAATILDACDIDPIDVQEALAVRPDPERYPAHWWLLSRVSHDILANMGQPVPIDGFRGYPPVPASTGAMGRYLPVWTFLTLVPFTRQFHQERDISAEISAATLGSALGMGLRAHRAATGLGGLGLWGFGWTLPLRLRGVDYQIGRLGFHIGEMSMSSGTCGHLLGVHILAGSPLTPDACDRSFDDARKFFTRHFPDAPITFFTCESWLMDLQLRDYLAPTSNIIQFQTHFSTIPLAERLRDAHQCDGDMRSYIFGAQASLPLAELPQATSLERAFVSHLQAGKHWYARTGWMPFAEDDLTDQSITPTSPAAHRRATS